MSPRSRKTDPRVLTAVRLEPETLDQLRRSGRGVSEEIRRCINQTLFAEQYDEPTRNLAEAIMWIAQEVSRQSDVPWHSNPNAHEALAAAIQEWLKITAPPDRGAVSDLFGPGDPPTLGRSIARHYQRFKAETAKSLQEMQRLHRGDKS